MLSLISDSFWISLTAERAFLARAFVDHCCANHDTARLEETLPVVTALAFRIQESYNSLAERVGELEEQRLFLRSESQSHMLNGNSSAKMWKDFASEEDEKADREFIIAEMLKLAVNLDYSDEIGRRKMFQLMRQSKLTSSAYP